MRNTTMVAVSAAAAAAAAALTGGAAQASTPDWLTLATVESEHDSVLPGVCESDQAGAITDMACGTVLGSPAPDEMAHGEALPETPAGYGGASLANVDLRNFAKWKVCGVAVAAEAQGAVCDNSIQGPQEPVSPGSGMSLVNADTTGAFQWSVCGFSVGQANVTSTC
ncbi:hypothetical protein SAMN05216298_2500 [Glycomyces sambucus]|uniref:Secreted protein n=1 Tax=Glycomyces sambucus TaxID=380244 RepID=A0A1G9GY56_9ACTN|nr:hypothetical protein [Glycomyces sambucus]SDL05596.1 hypothetical protein SAMN05216298_2500 [Glycomyces sambucus]